MALGARRVLKERHVKWDLDGGSAIGFGFEDLCKKLWGEIWQCAEIKKNGRSGQEQHGIDIYGIPKGEVDYFGIQCKGKDEDINAKLTLIEIDREIKKAKTFLPALKKLYFTTTANKDAVIETYIRGRDIENRKLGLFEVHLFSWEDIVDLIDENKATHDWYVSSNKYKSNFEIDLSFVMNGKGGMPVAIFIRNGIRFRIKTGLEIPDNLKRAMEGFSRASIINEKLAILSKLPSLDSNIKVNKSYLNFDIKLKNNSSIALSNYKLELKFEGDIELLEFGKVYERELLVFNKNYPFQIKKENKFHWILCPKNSTIVPDEEITFRSFSTKPLVNGNEVKIAWKFLSAEYSESGTITIDYTVDFKDKWQFHEVEDRSMEKTEESFDDYYEFE